MNMCVHTYMCVSRKEWEENNGDLNANSTKAVNTQKWVEPQRWSDKRNTGMLHTHARTHAHAYFITHKLCQMMPSSKDKHCGHLNIHDKGLLRLSWNIQSIVRLKPFHSYCQTIAEIMWHLKDIISKWRCSLSVL